MIDIKVTGDTVKYENGQLILNNDLVLPADDDITFETGVTITCGNKKDNAFIISAVKGDVFVESLLVENGKSLSYNPVIYNYATESTVLPKNTPLCNIVINEYDDKESDPTYIKIDSIIYNKDGLIVSYAEEGWKVTNVNTSSIPGEKFIEISLQK